MKLLSLVCVQCEMRGMKRMILYRSQMTFNTYIYDVPRAKEEKSKAAVDNSDPSHRDAPHRYVLAPLHANVSYSPLLNKLITCTDQS